MKSTIALTEEIGIREAADDLIAQIKRQITFEKNSCGLLYYDYEMAGDELCGYLRDEFGIDILGCSTVATLDNKNGYRDMSTVFMVLTADDCDFTVGLTEALTDDNAKQKISETFLETKRRAGSEPRLAYVIFPFGTGIVFDKHIQDLSEMSDHVPIVGGIPSAAETSPKSLVFNGRCYQNMAVMLLIGGCLRPVISLANVMSTVSDRKNTITKARDTTICEVDGKPFTEYIESFGINIREAVTNEGRTFFQKYPLLIANQEAGFNEQAPYVRILDHIDWDSGNGVGYAGIPEGAQVSLAVLERADITATVELGLRNLFQKMERSGRTFSTILCITCNARLVTLNPYSDGEGRAIQRMVPEKYNLAGFYSRGELCPIAVENDRAYNQLHNGSIVFCAF